MARWHDGLVALREAASAARAAMPAIYQAGDRAFAAADPLIVFGELRKYVNQGLAFLEWGSGLGTITIMADLIGYRAFGIERDERLVTAARQLAERAGSGARFGIGNFVPVDSKPAPTLSVPEEFAIATGGPDGYAAVAHQVNEFDLIYVFPHPELVDSVFDLFARSAKLGARLLLYCQTTEMLTSLRTPRGVTPLSPA